MGISPYSIKVIELPKNREEEDLLRNREDPPEYPDLTIINLLYILQSIEYAIRYKDGYSINNIKQTV